MSTVISISTRRRYGVARLCRVWGVARAGIYRRRRAAIVPPAPRRRPGPQGPMPDAALVEAIRRVLIDSPFHGEGYRKVWARLRHEGLRTSKERVRRLMRENGLSATTRVGSPRGPRNHDGTIIPEAINAMWGTDMTAAFTVEHGQVAVFIAVDHCSAECVGIHAALHGTRHEALEPVRQGVTERFGGVEKDAASGPRHPPRPRQPIHVPRLPEGDRLARGCVLPGLRPGARGQRLRRAVHPDPEGEPPLGQDLPDRRGSPPRPDRLQADLQRKLADRATWPPLASPVPTRPDGHAAAGRIIAIGCLTNPGAVQRERPPRRRHAVVSHRGRQVRARRRASDCVAGDNGDHRWMPGYDEPARFPLRDHGIPDQHTTLIGTRAGRGSRRIPTPRARS